MDAIRVDGRSFLCAGDQVDSFVGSPESVHESRGWRLCETPWECGILAELMAPRKRLEHAQRAQPAAGPEFEDSDHAAVLVMGDHLRSGHLGLAAGREPGALP